jgi:tetratricopeptide (TPR) repeat protein
LAESDQTEAPPEQEIDDHMLDFRIEDQGTISWENEAGVQDVSSSSPVEDSSEHALDFHPEESAAVEHDQGTSQSESSGFFDLAARLDTTAQQVEQGSEQVQSFSARALSVKVEAPEDLATSEIDDIVREFKQGVLEEVGAEDYETHYELGISYKEMSLLDDAIEELQLASLDPSRFVDCQGVIALCYLEKGDYDQGIQAFQEARSGVEKRGEKYQDLTYQIAASYEKNGRRSEAVQTFQELFQINPNYRDVKRRLNQLLA